MKKLGKWKWLWYPGVVLAVIIGGLLFLQSGGEDKITGLLDKQRNVETEAEKEAKLRTKLAALSGVDLAADSQNLQAMVTAMPAAKKAWLLLLEIRSAASEAGATVTEYKATGVGDVKEASTGATLTQADKDALSLDVTFKVDTFFQVQAIVTALEKYLPLVKVSKINFDKTKLQLTLAGGWGAWTKLLTDPTIPLPNYQVQSGLAIKNLQDKVIIPEAAAIPSGTVVNPQNGAIPF